MKKNGISIRGKISILAALAMVLVLQGCGLTAAQKKAIDDFSSATTLAGKTAVSELATMREEVIAMNIARIQLKGEEKDEPGLDKLDEAFTLEATSVRQRAAEAIRSYGELLKTLATTDRTEDIKKSTDDLLSSYEGLPDSYKTLKKDELDAIAKALQAVGGFWVEYKKAEAVKAVVNGSNAQIAKLCTMLEADFDPYQPGKLGSQFLNTTERLRVDADEVLEKSKGFSERAAATAAFEKAKANVLRRDNVEKVLSESIGRIAKANAQLVQAVNSKEYSEKDIEALQKNVKLLYDAIKVLRK
jgi:hypothetical protein